MECQISNLFLVRQLDSQVFLVPKVQVIITAWQELSQTVTYYIAISKHYNRHALTLRDPIGIKERRVSRYITHFILSKTQKRSIAELITKRRIVFDNVSVKLLKCIFTSIALILGTGKPLLDCCFSSQCSLLRGTRITSTSHWTSIVKQKRSFWSQEHL